MHIRKVGINKIKKKKRPESQTKNVMKKKKEERRRRKPGQRKFCLEMDIDGKRDTVFRKPPTQWPMTRRNSPNRKLAP